jgi:VWFA-related protein
MAILPHHYGWSSTLALIFPFVLFTGSTSDAPKVTYRTNAFEARITFFTTDENNQLVETVKKDDFAVVDSDVVIRDFRSLTRSNETALDVVAVVDASESVAPSFQATMNDVRQLVSQQPMAADDNVSIVSFSGLRPVVLCTGDCRSPAAGQRLLAVKAAGPTPLFDALAFAANFLSRRHKAGVRPVLILFSDGVDTISMTSAHDALEAVVASDAVVYTVDLNDSRYASSGSTVLARLAEATGGRYFSVHDGTMNVLQAALADLRASYVVTYPLPSRVAGFHSLRILPKHDLNLRFHCRSGYFYDEGIR